MNSSPRTLTHYVPEIFPVDHWNSGDRATLENKAVVLPPKRASLYPLIRGAMAEIALRIRPNAPRRKTADSKQRLEMRRLNSAVVRLEPEVSSVHKLVGYFTFHERPKREKTSRNSTDEDQNWDLSRLPSVRPHGLYFKQRVTPVAYFNASCQTARNSPPISRTMIIGSCWTGKLLAPLAPHPSSSCPITKAMLARSAGKSPPPIFTALLGPKPNTSAIDWFRPTKKLPFGAMRAVVVQQPITPQPYFREVKLSKTPRPHAASRSSSSVGRPRRNPTSG